MSYRGKGTALTSLRFLYHCILGIRVFLAYSSTLSSSYCINHIQYRFTEHKRHSAPSTTPTNFSHVMLQHASPPVENVSSFVFCHVSFLSKSTLTGISCVYSRAEKHFTRQREETSHSPEQLSLHWAPHPRLINTSIVSVKGQPCFLSSFVLSLYNAEIHGAKPRSGVGDLLLPPRGITIQPLQLSNWWGSLQRPCIHQRERNTCSKGKEGDLYPSHQDAKEICICIKRPSFLASGLVEIC